MRLMRNLQEEAASAHQLSHSRTSCVINLGSPGLQAARGGGGGGGGEEDANAMNLALKIEIFR